MSFQKHSFPEKDTAFAGPYCPWPQREVARAARSNMPAARMFAVVVTP